VDEAARMKGAGVRSLVTWHTERRGQAHTTRLLEHLAPADRALFDPSRPDLDMVDSTWYRAEVIHALFDGMIEGLSAEERTAFLRDGARAGVQATSKGLYRWFFVVIMSPERYREKAQALFSRYHQPGVITKTSLGPTGHLAVLRGWAGHHPAICEFLYWSSLAIYEAMSCRNVVGARVSCVSTGAAECRWTVHWEA
jgi:hypothetical protein